MLAVPKHGFLNITKKKMEMMPITFHPLRPKQEIVLTANAYIWYEVF